MTLHTIMPLELVLDGVDRARPEMVEIRMAGLLLQIEPLQPGIGRVVRLLDGPLENYLRPELQPGSVIAYGGQGQGQASASVQG